MSSKHIVVKLTAKKRKVGFDFSLYCSSESIVSVLAVTKRKSSSPNSFLIRRKSGNTALHGPHQAEYTSTTVQYTLEPSL